MITRIRIILQLPQPEKFHRSWSYPLYSALCQQVPPTLADIFHQQKITPVRQHITLGEKSNEAVWTLDLFGKELSVLTDTLQIWHNIYLDKIEEPLLVKSCQVLQQLAAMDLVKQAAKIENCTKVQMTFLTPCGFKTANHYAQYPTAELIVKSLFQRWNALMEEIALDDSDALKMILDGVQIGQYHLYSTAFPMKGMFLPGFSGIITLKSKLSPPMQELWKLLLLFSRYSGVGMKPALGMGAVTVKFL